MTDNKPKIELKISHCNHDELEYSLGIEVTNTHVELSSSPYPHCAGNASIINIYRMTPEDILKLGNLITAEAFQVKGLHEAGNADKG